MKHSARIRERAQSRGFTLIEVIVAIVILSVALLSLAQLMAIATRQNTLSGRVTSSSSLAKAQLEQLKATTFYTKFTNTEKTVNPLLAPGGDVDASINNYFQYFDPNGNVTTQGDALYVVRWKIEDVVAPGAPLAMKRITVRCLPAAEVGNQFQRIGDALFITYRTANVG